MDNKAAGALSRKLGGIELASLVVPTLLDMAAICAEVYEDTKLKETIEKLKADEDNVSNFSLQQGVLEVQGTIGNLEDLFPITFIIFLYSVDIRA